MRIKNNLQNFLMDQDYYIDIFKTFLHIYHYEELISLSDTYLELKLKEFSLKIEGENLTLHAMDKEEILIQGTLHSVRFER